MNITILDRSSLTSPDTENIVRLLREAWPNADGYVDLHQDIADIIYKEDHALEKHLLLHDDQTLAGYAKIYSRPVLINQLPVHNMALLNVCVSKKYQRQGYGHRIAKTAFSFVDNGTFKCSLYQTRYPDFYEKIGAQRISNTFINSHDLGKGNPWWDPYIMVYPAGFSLEGQVIDLQGTGY